jgi:hypothetical protein
MQLVSFLDFSNNLLTGTLPAAIFQLPRLRKFIAVSCCKPLHLPPPPLHPSRVSTINLAWKPSLLYSGKDGSDSLPFQFFYFHVFDLAYYFHFIPQISRSYPLACGERGTDSVKIFGLSALKDAEGRKIPISDLWTLRGFYVGRR